MSKLEFKTFVRTNPNLINYVNNNTMTWQKFYEMFELYGADNDIWNNYLINNSSSTKNLSDKSIKDVFNMIKDIDLNKVQQTIDNIQKTISVFSDLAINKTNSFETDNTPIYKKFED